MKRSQLQRRTRLKPLSPKRHAEQGARKLVEIMTRQRASDRCEFHHYYKLFIADVPITCAGPLDVHEIIPRSAWAQGYLDPTNCVALCRRHHAWVTDNPSAAHELGLHGYSWERPDGAA